MEKGRKIIQIAAVPMVQNRNSGLLYALCDDGTLWWKEETMTAKWQLEIGIPQDDYAYHTA